MSDWIGLFVSPKPPKYIHPLLFDFYPLNTLDLEELIDKRDALIWSIDKLHGATDLFGDDHRYRIKTLAIIEPMLTWVNELIETYPVEAAHWLFAILAYLC